MRPGEFELPRHYAGGWQIGAHHYDENPRWSVTGSAIRLVHRWLEFRQMSKGPLGQGGGLLPCAGGYFDQPAPLMAAFALFDRLAKDERE